MTGDEFEPHILPRQRRALERVATRLDEERPGPEPAFLARLDARVQELDAKRQMGGLTGWRLSAAVCLALGLCLLVVAAVLAVS